MMYHRCWCISWRIAARYVAREKRTGGPARQRGRHSRAIISGLVPGIPSSTSFSTSRPRFPRFPRSTDVHVVWRCCPLPYHRPFRHDTSQISGWRMEDGESPSLWAPYIHSSCTRGMHCRARQQFTALTGPLSSNKFPSHGVKTYSQLLLAQ
jgi:hypothetical protein